MSFVIRERGRFRLFTVCLCAALLASGCIVRERKQQEEALWHVRNGTTKAEIVRLVGDPDETTKPPFCKDDSTEAKEEIVYTFDYVLPILNKRAPRVTRYFCLNEDGTVVDCCGLISY